MPHFVHERLSGLYLGVVDPVPVLSERWAYPVVSVGFDFPPAEVGVLLCRISLLSMILLVCVENWGRGNGLGGVRVCFLLVDEGDTGDSDDEAHCYYCVRLLFMGWWGATGGRSII